MVGDEIKLNLGCGSDILPGWINIDLAGTPNVDVAFDLETCGINRLPFSDNSVKEIRASHLLEHIDRILPMMQELHRVARPNALLQAAMPHGAHDDAWADPTHRRAMWMRSFRYFQQPFYDFADYGYTGDWRLDVVYYRVNRADAGEDAPQRLLRRVDAERNLVWEMLVDLRAVKPVRARDRALMTSPDVKFVLTG